MITFWSNSEYRFLSNFHLIELDIDGKKWPSVEHYYQAQKSLDESVQESIRLLSTPGKAKRAGQKIELTKDWDHRKFSVMLKALLKKFEDPELKLRLLSNEELLVEDSPKDLIWGSGQIGSVGPGLNMLGKMLMLVRNFYGRGVHSPLDEIPALIPAESSFGAERKHDVHTGIDLHCEECSQVKSLADGTVFKVLDFTGTKAESPWWNDTQAVVIEHDFGFVLYGEVSTLKKEGELVKQGDILGVVKRVLKTDKGKPMTMLHLEWYKSFEEAVWWKLDEPMPKNLLNPLDLLRLFKGKL